MTSHHANFKPPQGRDSERGNIALVAALMVLALGAAGVAMTRLVQTRSDAAADIKLSNYAATLAQNVAESAVNNVLYHWNTGGVVGIGGPVTVNAADVASPWGTLYTFPRGGASVNTTYLGYAADVVTTCTYSVTVTSVAGNFLISATGTVTTPGTPGPSAGWRAVDRTVTATVPNVSPYMATGYTR